MWRKNPLKSILVASDQKNNVFKKESQKKEGSRSHYWTINQEYEVVFDQGDYKRSVIRPVKEGRVLASSPYQSAVLNRTPANIRMRCNATAEHGFRRQPNTGPPLFGNSSNHIGAMVSSSPMQPFSPFALSENMTNSAFSSSNQWAHAISDTASFTYTAPLMHPLQHQLELPAVRDLPY